MLIFFAVILAALGVALVLRGREARGLMVLAVTNATAGAVAAASGRWGWTAFALAWVAACGAEAAAARRKE